jgi:hypothetical protein
MNVRDGILRFRVRDHGYTVKQSGFGPDYRDGLERLYEKGNLQESVSEYEYYYGRQSMLSRSPEPVDAACNCTSKSDCDSTTAALSLSQKQADSKAHGTYGQF